jgi:ATP-dependent Zn protease
VLAKNRELLDEMAEELLRAEVLDGPVLRNFLARAVVPKEFSAWLKS